MGGQRELNVRVLWGLPPLLSVSLQHFKVPLGHWVGASDCQPRWGSGGKGRKGTEDVKEEEGWGPLRGNRGRGREETRSTSRN